MFRRLLIVVGLVMVVSCGAKPVPPTVNMQKFEDMNYPCIRIDFPDQIRYEGMKTYKNDDTLALVYKLVMPNYNIEVVKLYGIIDDLNWSYDALGEINKSPTTIYDKKGRDESGDAGKEDGGDISAIITVFERDGELFLRGSVGQFITKDRAFRVDVVRRIKSVGAFRRDVFQNWRNSATGMKSIDNMQKIVDFIYDSASVTDCKFRGNIDMDWWKK